MNLILPINAAAAKVLFGVGGETVGYTNTLSIVGLVTSAKVTVEIPRVEHPDVTNDAHWTAMRWDGEDVALTSENNVIRIPSHLLVRLNKTSDGSSFGVRWS